MAWRLFLGAVCIGFAPIFVRVLNLEPTPIGMYRCAIASVLLFAWIFFTQGKKAFKISRYPLQIWRLLIIAGALFALDLFVWHRSVVYAGAGIGTILGNTQVFYVALIGILVYKEKLTPVFVGSIFMAFLGIYLLVNFRESTEFGTHYRLGVVCGLATGIVYASYILLMREIESFNTLIRTEHALAFVSFFSAFFLFPISLIEGTLRPPSAYEFGVLFSLALIAQVFGWLLITKTLPKTPVSQAGLLLNAQPVVAVVAGDLFLKEKLHGLQLLGAGLTLLAIYLGTRFRQRVRKF